MGCLLLDLRWQPLADRVLLPLPLLQVLQALLLPQRHSWHRTNLQ